MNRIILQKTSLLSLSMTLASATLAVTEEPDDAVELAPYVVTGETYAFGAQKIVYVSEDDLKKLQANSLSDIFSLDPSIVVGGGIPAAERIYIRGIEDKLLNVKIDGATQAGYLSHHQSQFSIEPELLKHAEAEPGAGSAAVGPGALAGSIRLENKRANDFLESGQSAGVFAKASYGSNGDYFKLTGAAYGNFSEKLSAVFAYTYSDSNDYEDGDGDTIDLTGSETNRAFLGIDLQLDEQSELSFGFEDYSDEGTFRHRPNFFGYFNHPVAENKPVDMEFERQTVTVDYSFVPAESDAELDARIYYTDNSIDREGQYEMGYESIGLDLSAESSIDDHTIAYGLNYRDDSAYFTGKGSTSGFLPFPLVYETIPDEAVEVVGLFAQDDWQINDQFQASYGLRWDNYSYEDKDGQRFSNSGASINAGVSYAATEALDFSISYGTAFRGVTPIDLITANEGGVFNHPSIDPEWAENIEFGFQFDNGQFFANGTLYSQTITNVIVSNGTIRDNNGDLETKGYDFSFGIRQGDLTASLGVSDSKPELNGESVVDVANGLAVGTGSTWNANVEYAFLERRLFAGWNLNYVESFEEGDEPNAFKDSYFVHDLYLQWIIGEDDHIALTLTIDNIFDESYVDQATSGYNSRVLDEDGNPRIAGLPEPGRDIRLSASMKF